MTEPNPLAAVRVLSGLTVGDISDDDLAALLDANDNFPRLAAADALEVFASTLTSVQSDDISIDGSKRASVLMARSARLRAQAAQESADSDDGFYFAVAGGVDTRPELTERGSW